MTGRGTSYEGTPLAGPQSGGFAAERRVALVIGNAAYPSAPLRNPRNDAEAFAAKLQTVHPAFDVTVALDVGRNAMEDALEAFEAKLGDCDTALLFFAGHGLQVKGHNFLMPVDADIRQEIHLRRRAFSLNELLEIMGRRVRTSSLVFLDACRDNPFARSLLAGLSSNERGRFLTRSGLAEVRAATGSFIAFATAPDNVAQDGTGTNSPFTAALLAHLTTAGVSINDLMIAVRRDVLKATGGKQEPWDQSSLRERFCFCERPDHTTEIEVSQPTVSSFGLSETALFEKAALEHWEVVKGTVDPTRLHEFLSDYGTSRMGKLAREALQRLATANWRKVGRRDDVALANFIEHYAGTAEIPEASALLARRRAEHEAFLAKRQEASERAERRRKVKSEAHEAQDAPWWPWLWLGGVIAGTIATQYIFRNNVWGWFDRLNAHQNAVLTGWVVGCALSLASAVFLAAWRPRSAAGAGLSVYWLGGAMAVMMGTAAAFIGMQWNWFDPDGGATGGLLASLAVIISAVLLSRRRWQTATSSELATYWIGGNMAGVVALATVFEINKWVFFAHDSPSTAMFVACPVIFASAAWLIVRRWQTATRLELAKYWFGGIVLLYVGAVIVGSLNILPFLAILGLTAVLVSWVAWRLPLK